MSPRMYFSLKMAFSSSGGRRFCSCDVNSRVPIAFRYGFPFGFFSIFFRIVSFLYSFAVEWTFFPFS